MLSNTFDDWGGVGPMTLTFPSTSAGPGSHSAPLNFYIYSAGIAIPLRIILISVFHTCMTIGYVKLMHGIVLNTKGIHWGGGGGVIPPPPQ